MGISVKKINFDNNLSITGFWRVLSYKNNIYLNQIDTNDGQKLT